MQDFDIYNLLGTSNLDFALKFLVVLTLKCKTPGGFLRPKSEFHYLEILNCQNEFLVSKETVVLRRWERSKQKFGFIKRVDKG